MKSRVKTPPPQFYELNTEAEVARHLRYTDFEYDQAKTAIAVLFDVPYKEVPDLPGFMTGVSPSTIIAIIAGNRFQSIKANGNAELADDPALQDKIHREAGFPMLVPIPKDANGRSKILAHPATFRDGLWIVDAGSRKVPCIFIFKDGYEITADGIPTYGKGLRKVSSAITTYGNDIDGEQLLAWQQERRQARAA